MYIRKNLEGITPSLTLVLKSKVDEKRKKNIDVVSFTVGEPDFATPDHIKLAGIEAITNNFTKYTNGAGIPELREAIVEKLKKENGLQYAIDNIVVSNGGKQCISHAIFALINPGDDVLIPRPYWLSYPAMVNLAGGNSVFLETKSDNNYKITAKQLEQSITPKTRLFILNSPCNPTGTVYHRKDLESLVPIIKKTGITVISDEIYDKLLYDNASFTSLAEFPEIKDQVVLVNGVSKAFAMTGWRIGYLAAPKEMAIAIEKVQSHLTGNSCSISQKAACKAISASLNVIGQEEIKRMQKIFEARRNLAYKLIQEIPGLTCHKPEGAFYLFPESYSYYGKRYNEKVTIKNSEDLSEYLLEECNVSVVPGSEFGNDRNFRISFATSEKEIEKGMARIKEGLAKLK